MYPHKLHVLLIKHYQKHNQTPVLFNPMYNGLACHVYFSVASPPPPTPTPKCPRTVPALGDRNNLLVAAVIVWAHIYRTNTMFRLVPTMYLN